MCACDRCLHRLQGAAPLWERLQNAYYRLVRPRPKAGPDSAARQALKARARALNGTYGVDAYWQRRGEEVMQQRLAEEEKKAGGHTAEGREGPAVATA